VFGLFLAAFKQLHDRLKFTSQVVCEDGASETLLHRSELLKMLFDCFVLTLVIAFEPDLEQGHHKPIEVFFMVFVLGDSRVVEVTHTLKSNQSVFLRSLIFQQRYHLLFRAWQRKHKLHIFAFFLSSSQGDKFKRWLGLLALRLGIRRWIVQGGLPR